MGRLDDRDVGLRPPGSRAGGRGTASHAAPRRCRICSWTRRCPGRSARPGRSWSRATRSSQCRGSQAPRAGRALSAPRERELSQSPVTELTAGSRRSSSTRPPSRRESPSLAPRSRADYRDRDLLLIGVLKGAIFFMADLMRQIDLPCEVDFMAISSYGAGVDSSGVVRILKDLDIRSRTETLCRRGHRRLRPDALLPVAKPRGPPARVGRDLRAPDEAERRENDVECRYVGFEIPNRFVIGYGLGLRRAIPKSPLHRGVAGRSDRAAGRTKGHPAESGGRIAHCYPSDVSQGQF